MPDTLFGLYFGLCGDIRYEAEVTDTENWYCHCRSWISWLKIEDKLKREPTQENEYG